MVAAFVRSVADLHLRLLNNTNFILCAEHSDSFQGQ